MFFCKPICLVIIIVLACRCSPGFQLSSKKTSPPSDSTWSIPFHKLEKTADLDTLLNSVGDARIVLLGEASHGTSEYYKWRTAISEELILRKGFNIIALEGDWVDCSRINDFIHGPVQDSSSVINLLKNFDRWPTWLWGNYEMASFVKWLNSYNSTQAQLNKVNLHGFDLFSISETIDDILKNIPKEDTSVSNAVKRFQQCFQPYENNELLYGNLLAIHAPDCRSQASEVLRSVNKLAYPGEGSLEAFNLAQLALSIYDGEQYFRTRSNTTDSWNIRDMHMAQIIKNLLSFYGPSSRIIIWQHNSHVGDAQFANMHWTGRTNVGTLIRDAYGDKNVFIVGFGSYSGTVLASDIWAGPILKIPMYPADDGSWEQILHQQSAIDKFILFDETRNDTAFQHKWIYQRAVGVVYHSRERSGTYSLSLMSRRYDAYIFIDHSTALHPIDIKVKAVDLKPIDN